MSRRFQFALDPALQFRERVADAARDALGRAIRARREAETALATAEADVAEGLAVRAQPGTAAHLGGASAHRGRLARTAAAARRALDLRRAEEAAARAALADAVRALEALVALRSEAADAHRADAARRDTARLDDLAAAGRAARASTPLR